MECEIKALSFDELCYKVGELQSETNEKLISLLQKSGDEVYCRIYDYSMQRNQEDLLHPFNIKVYKKSDTRLDLIGYGGITADQILQGNEIL